VVLAKKLIICDLDGTLLNSMQELSPDYSDKLNQFLDKGVDFVVATGRDFENSKIALRYTHINNPIILTNGAILADYPSGRVIEFLTLPSESVSLIYRIAEKLHLEPMVIASYDARRNYPRFIKGYWWDPAQIKWLSQQDYTPYANEPIISIQFMNTKLQLDEFYALSQENPAISSHSDILYFEDAFLKGMHWLEFNPLDARKEVMVKSVIEKKGYTKENVIVFGDNFNDVGMFKLAGTVVVVDNASEDIKEHADYITASNTDGGVIQYIETHLEELI
jgi:Cof subfamily protein (haloacid dehalogenase superfamily)